MLKNSCASIFILILMILVSTLSANESTKLQDVLRKVTDSNNRSYNNTEDGILKAEAMKVVRRCQTDGSDNRKDDSGYGRNYNGYNNEENTRESDYRNDRYSSNYDSYNNNNNNNRNNRNYNGDRSNSNYPSNSRNCTDDRNFGSDSDGNDNNYRKNQDNYNTYRGEGSNGNYGFERNYFSSRIRREDRGNNDQCVSQCVFGYMNLMDENQVPSETLTIKWLQDHMANNDLKRIKALRETRRCFAKLTTSDIEDGCEFSKELSNCMNLDIE